MPKNYSTTTYQEKLRDPRWQKKRLEVFEESEFACSACGANDKELHVHHIEYWPGMEPWDYSKEWLQCLCKDCHEIVTDEKKKEKEECVANGEPPEYHKRVMGLLPGDHPYAKMESLRCFSVFCDMSRYDPLVVSSYLESEGMSLSFDAAIDVHLGRLKVWLDGGKKAAKPRFESSLLIALARRVSGCYDIVESTTDETKA